MLPAAAMPEATRLTVFPAGASSPGRVVRERSRYSSIPFVNAGGTACSHVGRGGRRTHQTRVCSPFSPFAYERVYTCDARFPFRFVYSVEDAARIRHGSKQAFVAPATGAASSRLVHSVSHCFVCDWRRRG